MNERLPEWYETYTAAGCDRLSSLQEYLLNNSVETSVVPIEGRRHLYVTFPSASYNPIFKIKTVLAHYDRVEKSPGANDNTSGVFSLAQWAIRLQQMSRAGFVHNVRIFFTDGEELGENGVSSQGAFGLAELFKKLGIANDDVYVFDSVGRGTVPILAQTGLSDVRAISKNNNFTKRFADLYDRTQNLLRSVSRESWMTLPVPYSDNAGFLACGIPAVAITMLPKEEATQYVRELAADKTLPQAVMNCRMEKDNTGRDVVPRFRYEEKMPKTWRLFHTEYDNMLSLTPESFDMMEKLLNALADMKTMA
jgi:hypothetical protein